jgi:hypothetical protein
MEPIPGVFGQRYDNAGATQGPEARNAATAPRGYCIPSLMVAANREPAQGP